MGTVLGPFDTDDWYTMGQLKLDLAFTRKKLKHKPNYELIEREVVEKLRSYQTRVAA